MRDDEPTLDLSPEEFRRLGHAAVELMAEALECETDDPVLPKASAAEVRAALDEPLPRAGVGPDAVLERLRCGVLPYLRRNGHPGFFAYVLTSVDPFGALVDGIASLLNQNVTGWRSAPAAATVERLVVRWLDESLGFDGAGNGLMTSGGSAANAIGVTCGVRRAQERAGGGADALARLALYATREAHVSFVKAARALGVADDRVRRVAATDARRMDPADLARAMDADRRAGLVPALVFASGGTVNTGAVDPLEAVAGVCAEHGAWLHVDGAYGAPAALVPENDDLRAGFARADSLSVDPHKWLFAPLDAGCALVRDDADLLRAYRGTADYLAVRETDPDEAYTFFERGPELSRRARALKVWAILLARGTDDLGGIVARNCALRTQLDARIEREPRLEHLGSGLSITCFRYRPEGETDSTRLDAANEAILDALVASGRFLLSPTRLEGRFALRVCIVNHRTRAEHLDALVDDVLAHGAAL